MPYKQQQMRIINIKEYKTHIYSEQWDICPFTEHDMCFILVLCVVHEAIHAVIASSLSEILELEVTKRMTEINNKYVYTTLIILKLQHFSGSWKSQ
jgi:hypothetical protein